jgi:chorismate-pyruvate lyase
MTAVPVDAASPAAPSRGGHLGGFLSPQTRMLLANNGLTTPLLEAVVGCALSTDVDPVRRVPATELDPAHRAALAVPDVQWCWLRLSRLLSDQGAPVSDNVVVARAGVHAAIDAAIGNGRRPIGYAMSAAGLIFTRRTVEIGCGPWPHRLDRGDGPNGGHCCAVKSYVLELDGVPVVYLRERYSPEFFSPALAGPESAEASPETKVM